MTIPKFTSTRDKWERCQHCNGTLLACKGLTIDRGHGCCHQCDHSPKETTDATE